MAPTQYLLDLPVYRLDESTYIAQRNAFIDAAMNKYPLPTTPSHPSISTKLSRSDELRRTKFSDAYGGSWRYNEIVGYIRLYFAELRVAGEYWRVKRKRTLRTRTKQFEWCASQLVPGLEIGPTSSADIYRVLLTYVEACHRDLDSLYIDTYVLETLGPHIDWQAFLDRDRGYAVCVPRSGPITDRVNSTSGWP